MPLSFRAKEWTVDRSLLHMDHSLQPLAREARVAWHLEVSTDIGHRVSGPHWHLVACFPGQVIKSCGILVRGLDLVQLHILRLTS